MSRLLQLKKNQDGKLKSIKKIEKKFVIVGFDLSSLILFDQLSSEFEKDNILVINDRETSPEEILHSWQTAALLGRGNAFQNFVKEDLVEAFKAEPFFYKDQTLKPFSGRAKPHKLLPYESFFIEKPFEVDFKKLFIDFEVVCAEYKNCSHNPQISEIFKEDGKWKIVCSDGSLVIAEKLYWTSSREEFYEKSSENLKESYSDNEKNFLLEHWNFSLLNVYFELSHTIVDESQTVFIPQSFTYDHGHFIVDFSQPKEDKSQSIRAYALIYDHTLSEEEVGKKIRHMKKSLQKVYPSFFDSNPTEEVRFLDGFLSSTREESQKVDFDSLPNLPEFVGTQAAFELSQYPLEIPTLASLMKSISSLKIDTTSLS